MEKTSPINQYSFGFRRLIIQQSYATTGEQKARHKNAEVTYLCKGSLEIPRFLACKEWLLLSRKTPFYLIHVQ